MNAFRESLRKKARMAPEGPGIYIHRNADKEILYVGKAKNLHNRLKSYFFGTENLPLRTKQLVSRIADFEIVLAQNENESLVLESQFIKSHQPPYNVLLKDHRGYPYVRINPKDPWPTLKMVRRRKEDGALYFGPYASGGQMFGVLDVVRRFFPLVKCSPHVFKTTPRPCNYYHMRQCLAPCHLNVEKGDYKKHVDAVISLLKGHSGGVRRSLQSLMQQASATLDYERAAMYRDQIRAIEELGQAQSVDLGMALEIDFLAVFWGPDQFSLSVFSFRAGQAVSSGAYSSKYAIDLPERDNEGALSPEEALRLQSLFGLLGQYFLDHIPAENIVMIDPSPIWKTEQSKDLQRFLRALKDCITDVFDSCDSFISSLKKNSARKDTALNLRRVSDSVYDNARQKYQSDKMLTEKSEQMLLGLQTFLGLLTPPMWIECFDISTFQGTETVASQVVFKEGKAAKKNYRKYIIRTLETQDDFGSLREVMRRRFRDMQASETPDLILVDGGEPQVREVHKTLVSLGFGHVSLVGIAKSRTQRSFASEAVQQSQERLVVPVLDSSGKAVSFETKILRVGSPEYRLVTQLRDEAHRFAITFHRQRRSKRTLRSELDGIAGMGPKRRTALLKIVDRPSDLLTMTPQSIAEKSGLPLGFCLKVTEELREKLKAQ